MFLYVIYKGIGYGEQSWSKSAYVCHYIMKHLDIIANLLHDNLSCLYICMNEHEVYKKLCYTMYITQIGNKMQNNSKAEMCR